MENNEALIVESVCKLEKIFPSVFFDVMEHLPYEVKVGGLVSKRLMYLFERYMFTLKKKVKNNAMVEGFICEAYILEKILNFASLYFKPHL